MVEMISQDNNRNLGNLEQHLMVKIIKVEIVEKDLVLKDIMKIQMTIGKTIETVIIKVIMMIIKTTITIITMISQQIKSKEEEDITDQRVAVAEVVFRWIDLVEMITVAQKVEDHL
jgi:hypothetical protein